MKIIKEFIKTIKQNRRVRKTYKLDFMKTIVTYLPKIAGALWNMEKDLDEIKDMQKIRERREKYNDR